MKPCHVIRCVCRVRDTSPLASFNITHTYESIQQAVSKRTCLLHYEGEWLGDIKIKKRTAGHFQCRSNTGIYSWPRKSQSMQYLKSHYHEQTPFLSLNYKSVNGLIYLLCPWPILRRGVLVPRGTLIF